MTNVKEIWLPVVNYEKYYHVSNLGNVKSLERDVWYDDRNIYIRRKEKVRKKYLSKQGYYRTLLQIQNEKNSLPIHRLVAQAFLPNKENKPFVNHINGIKNDNRVENLEWVTASENTIHASKNNLLVRNGKVFKIKLDVNKVLDIRKMLFNKIPYLSIMNKYAISKTTVSSIRSGIMYGWVNENSAQGGKLKKVS